jgi:CheY-like chemotaxis protein
VVDDNVDAAESFSMLLQDMGNSVLTAHDGVTALRAAPTFLPHAVMLDIGLPGLNGYEVAARLREIPGMGTATLVAVTGWGDAEDRRRTREAGFSHHVVKPVSRDTLQKLMSDLVARHSPSIGAGLGELAPAAGRKRTDRVSS